MSVKASSADVSVNFRSCTVVKSPKVRVDQDKLKLLLPQSFNGKLFQTNSLDRPVQWFGKFPLLTIDPKFFIETLFQLCSDVFKSDKLNVNTNPIMFSSDPSVKKTLDDLDNEKREKVESLEQELARKQEEAGERLRVLMKEAEIKIAARDTEAQESKARENDLSARVQSLTLTEGELREKVHTSEIEFSEKLHLANIRERDLTEKINQLTKQLDEFKFKADNEKRELEEKLNLSQDELLVTRQSRNSSGNESFLNRTISLNQSQLLQDEVESLRCVLELKQSEISELRKHNGELQRAADDSLAAQAKCSALESRVEDLQVQLGAKHEEEK